MTRRQIVTTLIFIFIAAGSVGAAASQKPAVEERGAIQGVVTRAGTTDPLNGAQVTLQGGAANPQAIQILLNTAASQGIVVKPEPGASTSQIIQANKLFAWESVRPFAYQNAAFIAKDENRGRLIHVGQDNTVNAELTIIR